MNGPDSPITAYLAQLRRRWQTVRALKLWIASGFCAAAVALLALAVQTAAHPSPHVSAWMWSAAIVLSAACIATMARVLRGRPSDVQLARLAEERCPELDDA